MKRIALFLPGGLGAEQSGIHVPALYDLVSRLSETFDIVAYSHSLQGWRPSMGRCGNAKVRFLGANVASNSAWRALTFLGALTRDHRRSPFQLVHGFWGLPFGCYAVLAEKMLGIPSVVSLHGGETANLPEIDYGMMRKEPQRRLMRWTCLNARSLLVQSQFQAMKLLSHGIVRGDVHVIPPGVDLSLFSPRSSAQPTPPYHLLWIGDLRGVKDPVTLLRAFALVSSHIPATLRIIGQDHLRGSMVRLADQLGVTDRVEFLGFVKHSDIPRHFEWADILLQTSHHEGGGVVVAEAAASGVVICGTNVGLLSDLADEAALAVEPGDHELLAARVIELLQHRDQYCLLRQNALAWARRNSAELLAKQVGQLYLSIIDSSSNVRDENATIEHMQLEELEQ